jgi:hypothetical protein
MAIPRQIRAGFEYNSIGGWSIIYAAMVPLRSVLQRSAATLVAIEAPPYSCGGGTRFRSCETAVTICAGANGFTKSRLFGTPCEAHWSPDAPLM